MIPKEIIEKAIEGGWRPTYLALPHLHNIHCDYEIALDRTFWIALGKVLGWSFQCEDCGAKGSDLDEFYCTKCQKIVRLKGDWFVFAHRFYDLILTGQNTDEFWQSLLT